MFKEKVIKAWNKIKKVWNAFYDFVDSYDKPTKGLLCIGLLILILELVAIVELLILLV